MKNSFLKEFNEREYFNQCTNLESLSGLMDKKKIRAYIGFDCTAQSLHVGSLLQIMCLRLLQKHGHQPIILLGGGTTRIGVKSGGCAGMSYVMEYAKSQNPNDELIEEKGVKVFIDPGAVMYLLGTTMDFKEEEFSSSFVFNNPNETERCGCGESFKV